MFRDGLSDRANIEDKTYVLSTKMSVKVTRSKTKNYTHPTFIRKKNFGANGCQGHFFEKTKKQGNRGDMRKIDMTLQFSEASGPQGQFFEKTRNPL